jgi:hypothetical protein
VQGTTYRITWENTPDIDMVTIGYKACDSCLDWIAYNIPNTGFYDWNVAVGYAGITQFKLEIIAYDTGVGSVIDYSDNFFTVLPPPPPTSTNTPTATPTSTPSSGNSTGWVSPTRQAAVSSGDGNGYELNAANVFSNDGLFAMDVDSGTTTAITCGDTGKDKHKFLTYNLAVPAGAAVQGIELRLDARADSAAGTPVICASLSWNSGSSWTAWRSTTALGTAETSYILGGPADLWSHPWLPSELTGTALQVRLADVSNDPARDFSLDWAAINVTYLP